jgi:hypothetical protein
MFVNFEIGALKEIKLKGTEGPHVSYHGVFQPRAPAVAARPPAPTVSHRHRAHATAAAPVSTAPSIAPPHTCAPPHPYPLVKREEKANVTSLLPPPSCPALPLSQLVHCATAPLRTVVPLPLLAHHAATPLHTVPLSTATP